MRKPIFTALASLMVLILVIASGCSTSSPTVTGPNSMPPTDNPTSTVSPDASPNPIAPTDNASPTLSPDSSGPALSFIVAAPVSPASDATQAYQPPALKSPPQYATVNETLSFGDSQPANIPLGSTIYHWKNKITEAVGPDNSVLFICKDTEVAKIPTPGAGVQPVTLVIGVPNGAMISHDPNSKDIMKISKGNDIIGTIVTKPEDFPYAPTQIRNSSQQYIASGLYADGSSSNITSQVIWNSSNPVVATVSSNGLVTALADGTANITASLQGITSVPVELTVNSLISVSISDWSGVGAPRTLTSLPIGATWYIYATGTYSDGSTADITHEVTWTSSNPEIATIDSGGIVTGISDGADSITASLYGITSSPISFAVVSLSSIAVSAPEQLKAGSKVWVSATGIYNDGSKDGIYSPVTWNSSDTSVATISTDGLVTAISEGTTEITASTNGITSKPAILAVVVSLKTPNQ
ncbi:MAG: Ig-like domain-containing protein [Chloroflexota bacterium]